MIILCVGCEINIYKIYWNIVYERIVVGLLDWTNDRLIGLRLYGLRLKWNEKNKILLLATWHGLCVCDVNCYRAYPPWNWLGKSLGTLCDSTMHMKIAAKQFTCNLFHLFGCVLFSMKILFCFAVYFQFVEAALIKFYACLLQWMMVTILSAQHS